MGRGGSRKGAGRKSPWNHTKTELIRVPKEFVEQVLDLARKLDEGNPIEDKPLKEEETPVSDLANTQPPRGQLNLLEGYFASSIISEPSSRSVEEAEIVTIQIPIALQEKVLKLTEEYERKEKLKAEKKSKEVGIFGEPCPYCGSTDVRGHGFYKYKGRNDRMFRCHDCKRFIRRPNL